MGEELKILDIDEFGNAVEKDEKSYYESYKEENFKKANKEENIFDYSSDEEQRQNEDLREKYKFYENHKEEYFYDEEDKKQIKEKGYSDNVPFSKWNFYGGEIDINELNTDPEVVNIEDTKLWKEYQEHLANEKDE